MNRPPAESDFVRTRTILLRHESVLDAEVIGVADDLNEVRITAVVDRRGSVGPTALNAYLLAGLRDARLLPEEYIFVRARRLGDLRRLAGRLGRGAVISDLDLSFWLADEAHRGN
jgi:hypothetical protein